MTKFGLKQIPLVKNRLKASRTEVCMRFSSTALMQSNQPNEIWHMRCTALVVKIVNLNRHSFLIDSVQPTILVSQINKIMNSSIDGAEQNVLYGNLKRAVALDYHYQKKLVFFTDVQEKKIYRTTYGSKEVKVDFA